MRESQVFFNTTPIMRDAFIEVFFSSHLKHEEVLAEQTNVADDILRNTTTKLCRQLFQLN